MASVPSQPSLIREVMEIKKRLRRLETRRILGNATISEGDLKVDGGTFQVIDTAGNIVGLLGLLGDGTVGVGFWRADGTAAFQVDPNFVALYDKAGNPVVSDDYKHGSGLATPWVGGGVVLADTNTGRWPQTTSGTFVDIATGWYRVQNPRLSWDIAAVCDAGTAGEIRMLVDGTQVDSTQTVGGSFIDWYRDRSAPGGNVALPAGTTYGSIVSIRLQARRTSGTGIVYAIAQRFEGDQSP